MNERANQALLESGFSEAFVWVFPTASTSRWGKQREGSGLTGTPLGVLPRGRCAAAIGPEMEISKGAVAMWSKDFLTPGGFCLSPSSLSTCPGGLQNSVPNT